MSVDPLNLIQRPSVPAVRGDLRRAKEFSMGDLDTLSATPGSPGYAEKMAGLRQQTLARGDAEEIRGMQEPPPALILPELAAMQVAADQKVASLTKRVAIYYGKNDTYNVAVESAPDWDTEYLFRGQDEPTVKLLVRMASELGAKVSDKTGDFSE